MATVKQNEIKKNEIYTHCPQCGERLLVRAYCDEYKMHVCISCDFIQEYLIEDFGYEF